MNNSAASKSRSRSAGQVNVRESADTGVAREIGIFSVFCHPYVRLALKAVCFSVAYYLAAMLSLAIRYPGTTLSPVFLPNSIFLAALLLSPRRVWWIYVLAFIPAHFLSDGSFSLPLWWLLVTGCHDILLAMIAASLVSRFSRQNAPFETLRYAMIFTIFGVAVAIVVTQCLTSAFVHFVISDLLHLNFPWSDQNLVFWRRALLSNVVPFLVVTPAVMLWVRNGKTWLRKARSKSYVEICCLGVGLAITWHVVFSNTEFGPALLYAPLPFLIWAAVRFGPGGTSTSLVITVALAVWSAIHNRGPFTSQTQDGSVLNLQIFLIAVSAPMLFVGSLVEERKQTASALRRHEERLKLALSAGRMGTWDWHIRSGKMRWSHQISPVLNLSRAGSDNDIPSLLDLALPADRTLVSFSLVQTAETGLPLNVEFRTAGSDGAVHWVFCKGRGQWDEEGHLIRVLGIAIDVTERKNLEDELRNSEREFSALVENSPDVIFRLDRELRYTYISPAVARVLGVKREQFLDRTVSEMPMPTVHREGLTRACNEALGQLRETGRTFNLNGHYYRVRIIPEFSSSGAVESLLGITEDITERKIAEDALHQNENELRTSRDQVRELAGELIAAQEDERKRISRELHDNLNQRLAALSILVSNIKRELGQEDHAIEQLTNVQQRVSTIAEEIRRVSHRLRPASLDAGLTVALKALAAEFSWLEDMTIGLSLPASSERIPDDVALCLYRVAQESLHNIAKHSGAKHAEIGLTCDDGQVGLQIKDDGCGFDPVVVGSRMGLGLLSMEERVRLIQGNFSIQAKPGRGTTISASFPLKKGITPDGGRLAGFASGK